MGVGVAIVLVEVGCGHFDVGHGDVLRLDGVAHELLDGHLLGDGRLAADLGDVGQGNAVDLDGAVVVDREGLAGQVGLDDVAEGELVVVLGAVELDAARGVLDDDGFLRGIVVETAVGGAAEVAHHRAADQGTVGDLEVGALVEGADRCDGGHGKRLLGYRHHDGVVGGGDGQGALTGVAVVGVDLDFEGSVSGTGDGGEGHPAAVDPDGPGAVGSDRDLLGAAVCVEIERGGRHGDRNLLGLVGLTSGHGEHKGCQKGKQSVRFHSFAGLKRRRKNKKSLGFGKPLFRRVHGKLSTIRILFVYKILSVSLRPKPVDGFVLLANHFKKG